MKVVSIYGSLCGHNETYPDSEKDIDRTAIVNEEALPDGTFLWRVELYEDNILVKSKVFRRNVLECEDYAENWVLCINMLMYMK